MTHDNILYKINTHLQTMSKSEKQVASVILKSPNDVINMNLATLAKISQVSEPTVVRVFNGLGFKKYAEFKVQLAQAIVPMAPFRHDSIIADDGIETVIQKTCNNSINAIQMAEHEFDSTDIAHAVSVIIQAKFVGILSAGLTEIVALDAEHKFNRLGVRCATFFRITQQLILSQNLGSGDVLLLISQSGTTRKLVDVAAKAKQQGCKIVCITAPDSPLSVIGDTTISIRPYKRIETMTPLDSRLIHHILINILSAAIAIGKGEPSPDQLPALDSWIENKIQSLDMEYTD